MRLIDADALYEKVDESHMHNNHTGLERILHNNEHSHFKYMINQSPTIEAEPVKRGEWVETEPDEDDRKIGIEFSIKCSRCHDENSHLDFNENHEITGKTFWKSRFCPNCGAKMFADGGTISKERLAEITGGVEND